MRRKIEANQKGKDFRCVLEVGNPSAKMTVQNRDQVESYPAVYRHEKEVVEMSFVSAMRTEVMIRDVVKAIQLV
jgi:hypothetical protein